jgi:uncharacterized protein (TIGR03067 family)
MTAPLLTGVFAADSDTTNDSDTLPARMEDYWDEPPGDDRSLRTAYNDLQGAWFSFSGRREAEFLISGSHFTVRFADGDIYMGAFELHPEDLPKRMEMRIEEGPTRHKGKTTLCIYELDGRTMRWCTGNPGNSEHLAAFPSEDAPDYLCMRFRREQPV